MRTKIILADGEASWRLIVRELLQNEGYEVLEAENGRQTVDLLRAVPDVCLVIVDVLLPVMDGIAACEEIRSFSQVPILMVTARDDEETEVAGIRCGADQYISKPVKMRAFIERVRSLLKRAAGARQALCFGDLVIDLQASSVRLAGREILLTPKEYDLLLFLAQTPNAVKSREQILHAVWNTDYYGDGRTVDTHIKNLRMKLGPRGDLLRTVRSRGYMLEEKR